MLKLPKKKKEKAKAKPKVEKKKAEKKVTAAGKHLGEGEMMRHDAHWKNLSQTFKEQIILDWSVNGGVVQGKRYSKVQLSETIGLSMNEIDKNLMTIQKGAAKIFEDPVTAREHIFSLINKVLMQMQSDRGRAVLHADILENELTKIQEEMKKCDDLPTTTAIERNFKSAALRGLMTQFRSLSFHKIESMRALFESTEGFIKVLNLFAGNGKKGGDVEGLLSPSRTPPPQGEVLDHAQAVKLLENTQDQVLPSQDFAKMGSGPKNPNLGFEEFKDPEVE